MFMHDGTKADESLVEVLLASHVADEKRLLCPVLVMTASGMRTCIQVMAPGSGSYGRLCAATSTGSRARLASSASHATAGPPLSAAWSLTCALSVAMVKCCRIQLCRKCDCASVGCCAAAVRTLNVSSSSCTCTCCLIGSVAVVWYMSEAFLKIRWTCFQPMHHAPRSVTITGPESHRAPLKPLQPCMHCASKRSHVLSRLHGH